MTDLWDGIASRDCRLDAKQIRNNVHEKSRRVASNFISRHKYHYKQLPPACERESSESELKFEANSHPVTYSEIRLDEEINHDPLDFVHQKTKAGDVKQSIYLTYKRNAFIPQSWRNLSVGKSVDCSRAERRRLHSRERRPVLNLFGDDIDDDSQSD